MIVVCFFFQGWRSLCSIFTQVYFCMLCFNNVSPHEVSADSSFPHTDQHLLVPCTLDVALPFASQLSASCQPHLDSSCKQRLRSDVTSPQTAIILRWVGGVGGRV